MKLDFGKGYEYVTGKGIYLNDEIIIDEETLWAITYFMDFVKATRKASGLWGD